MTPASRFKRFLAYIIDAIILSFVSSIIILPFVFESFSQTSELQLFITRYYSIVLTIVMLFYFPFFESSKFQATLGKKVFNLYVSDSNDQRINYSTAFARCFIWILPSLPIVFLQINSKTIEEYNDKMSSYWWLTTICFLLYCVLLLPIFGKERTTLYDILTSTRVSKKITATNESL